MTEQSKAQPEQPPRPLAGIGLMLGLDTRARTGDTITRTVGLAFLSLNLFSGHPGAAVHGQGLLNLVLGGTCALLWLVWTFAYWVLPRRWQDAAVFVLPVAFGLTGAVLAGLLPTTAGAVYSAVAALTLAVRTRISASLALTCTFASIVLV